MDHLGGLLGVRTRVSMIRFGGWHIDIIAPRVDSSGLAQRPIEPSIHPFLTTDV